MNGNQDCIVSDLKSQILDLKSQDQFPNMLASKSRRDAIFIELRTATNSASSVGATCSSERQLHRAPTELAYPKLHRLPKNIRLLRSAAGFTHERSDLVLLRRPALSCA